jgi:hypothetical protein
MEIALITLGVTVLGTNVFWAIVVHRLVNKAMSNNYTEYVQAETLKQPRQMPKTEVDPIAIRLEQDRADELNQLMGVV